MNCPGQSSGIDMSLSVRTVGELRVNDGKQVKSRHLVMLVVQGPADTELRGSGQQQMATKTGHRCLLSNYVKTIMRRLQQPSIFYFEFPLLGRNHTDWKTVF